MQIAMDTSAGRLEQTRQTLSTMRSAMEADGGGAEIVELRESIVYLRFRGTCLYCPSRLLTRRAIEQTLKAALPWIGEIIDITPPRCPVGEAVPGGLTKITVGNLRRST